MKTESATESIDEGHSPRGGFARWGGRRRTAIGVDVGGHSVKAVQLVRSRRGWRVAAAACLPRRAGGGPVAAGEAAHLAGVLRRRGFCGSRVVLAVPEERMLTATLELPPRVPGVAMDPIARAEFARTHKCDPASFELAWWELPPTPRGPKTTHALAACCPHDAAEALLGAFESAGFAVAALDLPCLALARACAPLAGPGPAPAGESAVAVLDLGYRRAALLLLYRGAIVYERSLARGGAKALRESLAGQLRLGDEAIDYLLSDVGLAGAGARPPAGGSRAADVSEEVGGEIAAHFDALVHELRASFTYAGRQYPDAPVRRLLLAGGGAMVPGLPGRLSAGLGCEVRLVTPLTSAACPAAWAGACTPALTTAAGLAQFAAA